MGECVVQGCGQQRLQICTGILDPDPGEDVAGLVHEHHQVVRGVSESRVVCDAVPFRDHHGASLELDHECGSHRQDLLGRGDADRAAAQAGQICAGAGECHGGVQGDGRAAGAGQRCEHVGAVCSGGVDHELTAGHDAAGGDTARKAGKLVVGHGEQQHFGAFNDRGHITQWHAWQQLGGTVAGCIRYGVGADDRMPLGAQRCTQHGADSARTDDADPQTWRVHECPPAAGSSSGTAASATPTAAVRASGFGHRAWSR